MSGMLPGPAVSPFVSQWLPAVARGLDVPGVRRRALDLAMGEGRHAFTLAETGFATFGVDLSFERMQTARAGAARRGVTLDQWVADLDTYPLPPAWFDLLLCTRFLLRRRWRELRDTIRPGGFVIYETFTTGQISRGFGPSSLDHLLEPGELRDAFSDWHVLFCEEVHDPAALARLVARKPNRS
jgi:tellurite methyltransferase